VNGPARAPRQQRFVFGEVARTYDRRRPSYPSQFIDAVLAFAGLDQDATTPVAEVGAGTGKASALFAARAIPLTCLEPSPAMAAIARRNLAGFRDAAVQETSFEDWRPAAHGYGLLFAAQSWHWVSPEVRYVKACRALRPYGTLAVFWNVMVSRGGDGLERDLSIAYGDLVQGKCRPGRGERVGANDWVLGEMEASGLFEPGPATVLHEPWLCTYETESWRQLLSTHSDHRMLDEDTRAELLDRIRAAVDANGGRVEVGYVTVGYLARTRARLGERDDA
jgi:SAM-dependent methyltransferase